ncbi:L,D-transpeptidase [Corynebacterium sp. 32222D000AT]|uniref:L,D-transpeptidase n=1 Tax=unclassified Corynebacterium TaxID=2624378 RepID=UPI002A9301BB|nr:L,D-transpeptidase [Mycobacteriaceae bacterium]MDY5828382.1 L,D-transpeptidase [Corynebacterium sp.]
MSKFRFNAVPLAFRRAALALAATVAMAVTLIGGVPNAHAQQMPDPTQLSSQVQLNQGSSQLPNIDQLSKQVQEEADKFFGGAREQAWNTRNQMLNEVNKLNPQAANALRPVVDNVLNALFPGLVAQKQAEAKAAREAAARAQAEQAAREKAAAEAAARKAEQERQRNAFNRGPCPADAAVCVDLDGRRTWLQKNGDVTYVAPSMAPGKTGQETPRGTFHVNRKIKDEISYEFNNAPMPYAIYFTNNGHAFHLGDPAYDSAGCVRLPDQAAIRYFNDLQIGDKVFIY